jgi:hypothetical protein
MRGGLRGIWIQDMYARILILVCFAIAVSTLGACAGKLEKPQRFAAAVQKYLGGGSSDAASVAPSGTDAGTVETPACVLGILRDTCGLAGCHAKGSPQVDLASDGVVDRLIDQESGSALCKGRTYVATDGTSSLLLDKLTASPPCGVKMPVGGSLSAANMRCLTDWVSSLNGGDLDAGGVP